MPAAGVPAAPALPEDLEAVLRRLRLPHMRAHAAQVLATAKSQRWDPAEVLRVLLGEEVAGRERSALATRRAAAAFPTGKTFEACPAPGLMETSNPQESVTIMVAPRKYPDELRERAIRLTVEARQDPAARSGACRRIGEQLGVNSETLRSWVTQAEIDAGVRSGTTSEEAKRIAELERENRELRRANAILKSASAFFAAELDRPQR